MATSRIDSLRRRIETATKAANWERVAELTIELIKLRQRGECPRCLCTDVQLTEDAISCPGGKVQRVCIMCFQEIKAAEFKRAVVYTKGGLR